MRDLSYNHSKIPDYSINPAVDNLQRQIDYIIWQKMRSNRVTRYRHKLTNVLYIIDESGWPYKEVEDLRLESSGIDELQEELDSWLAIRRDYLARADAEDRRKHYKT